MFDTLWIELIHFLKMGGYAIYVWPAYFIVAVILIFNSVLPVIQRKRFLQELNANDETTT